MDNRELVHHETDGAAFDLPARWSYREMLAYESVTMLERAGMPLYERLWAGVRVVAQNWRGEIELRVDLDEIATAKGLEVIKWAAMLCWSAFQAMRAEELPKNS